MPSKAWDAFSSNKADIDRLWAIHQDVAGAGPGRKHDVEVLNRAAIVFITACWESYVEDVALEGFDFLVANAPDASKVPGKVRALASAELREAVDATKVWELADQGWKQVLTRHRAAVKKRWLDSLNTPKTEQVDSLFKDLLGLSALHAHWHWKGMPAEKAKDKLDDYITVRGAIAHRLKHDEAVYKDWSTDYLGHVERLVNATDGAVAAHLEQHVGMKPW